MRAPPVRSIVVPRRRSGRAPPLGRARGPRPALRGRGPSRAAVGLACGRRLASQDGQRGDPHPGYGGERRGAAEECGRPRLSAAAPLDPRPGRVDMDITQGCPGRPELGRVPEFGGDVLGRAPESRQRHDQESHHTERAHRFLHSGGGRRLPLRGLIEQREELGSAGRQPCRTRARANCSSRLEQSRLRDFFLFFLPRRTALSPARKPRLSPPIAFERHSRLGDTHLGPTCIFLARTRK